MMKPLLTARLDRAAPSVDAGDDRHPEFSRCACDATDRRSRGCRDIIPILYLLSGIVFSCGPGCRAVRAAFDAVGQRPPINGTIDAAATSPKVSWPSQYPRVPPGMHLVLSGSSPDGNAGAVPAARPTTSTPVITGVTPTQDSISYQWETPVQYTSYNVRITGRPQVNTRARQYTWPDLDAGSSYTVSVQGCSSTRVGAAACSGWASKAVSTLPPTPTPVTDSGP